MMKVRKNEKEGTYMGDRIRIADIAQELGVSTATVSNVIHGKTKKISDRTVKRVQELYGGSGISFICRYCGCGF